VQEYQHCVYSALQRRSQPDTAASLVVATDMPIPAAIAMALARIHGLIFITMLLVSMSSILIVAGSSGQTMRRIGASIVIGA